MYPRTYNPLRDAPTHTSGTKTWDFTMDDDLNQNTRSSLKRHVYEMIIPCPTVGLDDIDDEAAKMYLDQLMYLLLDTLADADPWRETWGLFDEDSEGRVFGLPESFSDLPLSPLLRDAIVNFGPVTRDPQTVEGKNRLVAWLRLRHQIISGVNGLPDMTISMADHAAMLASGGNSPYSRQQFLTVFQIEDSAFYFARDIAEPSPYSGLQNNGHS